MKKLQITETQFQNLKDYLINEKESIDISTNHSYTDDMENQTSNDAAHEKALEMMEDDDEESEIAIAIQKHFEDGLGFPLSDTFGSLDDLIKKAIEIGIQYNYTSGHIANVAVFLAKKHGLCN